MTSDEQLKSRLRAQAGAARAAAHAALARSAAGALARQFLDALPWQAGQVISGYLPMRDEADILPLMRELDRRGARLALPVVAAKAQPLLFRRWAPGAPLEAGVFGTSHPPASADILIPDLLLVPLLAFDESGTRLGYGGGYYDRSLAALREVRRIIAVGIGYEAQRLPSLPCESHDQKLDWMVTEQRVREFGS
jgi:5-formyltetrahydrofolate cyclo-ligase